LLGPLRKKQPVQLAVLQALQGQEVVAELRQRVSVHEVFPLLSELLEAYLKCGRIIRLWIAFCKRIFEGASR
jgi:hypothetical protein